VPPGRNSPSIETAGSVRPLQHRLGDRNAERVALGQHRALNGPCDRANRNTTSPAGSRTGSSNASGRPCGRGRAERVAIRATSSTATYRRSPRNRERDDAACLLEAFDLAAGLRHCAARLDLVRREIADLNQQVVQAVSRSTRIRRIEMLQLSLDEIERFGIEQLTQFGVAQNSRSCA
jgi:hypothetical protein